MVYTEIGNKKVTNSNCTFSICKPDIQVVVPFIKDQHSLVIFVQNSPLAASHTREISLVYRYLFWDQNYSRNLVGILLENQIFYQKVCEFFVGDSLLAWFLCALFSASPNSCWGAWEHMQGLQCIFIILLYRFQGMKGWNAYV